jgi:membrane protein
MLINFYNLLKATFLQWIDKDPFKNSVVIAYYTIFSLPGLLVIVISIAGYFYDEQMITHEITSQIGRVMGPDTALDVESIFKRASESKGSIVSSIIGIGTMLFGATGVFYHLQQMLN